MRAALLLLPLLLGATVGSSGNGGASRLPDEAAPPRYCASTNGTVSTGTTNGTVTSILYLFHPSTETKRYKVRYGEIHGSAGSGTGRYLLRITAITAQNGTPGGTVQPALPLIGTNPASGAVVRSGAAAPTRQVGDYFVDSMSATAESDLRFDYIWGFQPITLLGGVASGLELRTEVTSTLSSGADVAAWVCWTED